MPKAHRVKKKPAVTELSGAHIVLEAILTENAKLRRVIDFVRRQGEHTPLCNAPPYEATLSDAAWLKWYRKNKDRCTCWRNEMEELLRSSGS